MLRKTKQGNTTQQKDKATQHNRNTKQQKDKATQCKAVSCLGWDSNLLYM